MYKVTIAKKESFEKVVLKYESRTDAFLMVESVFYGDMECEYKCEIEIEEEGENHEAV